jgi:hypothetical protein
MNGTIEKFLNLIPCKNNKIKKIWIKNVNYDESPPIRDPISIQQPRKHKTSTPKAD